MCEIKTAFQVRKGCESMYAGAVILFRIQPSSDTTMRRLSRSKPASVGLYVA